jgi:hypothetical protein
MRFEFGFPELFWLHVILQEFASLFQPVPTVRLHRSDSQAGVGLIHTDKRGDRRNKSSGKCQAGAHSTGKNRTPARTPNPGREMGLTWATWFYSSLRSVNSTSCAPYACHDNLKRRLSTIFLVRSMTLTFFLSKTLQLLPFPIG